MPQYTFPLTAILQALDTGAWLAEVLFFPGIACLGDEPEFLHQDLAEHARRLLEGAEALHLHRLTAGGPARAETVSFTLEAPARSVTWREPLTLSFPVVYWDHGPGPEACVAYLPTLGIEVLAPSAAELEGVLPTHIRAALMRARAATSLERLVWLQRCQAVRVDPLRVRASVRRPLALARKALEQSQRRKSVLEEVATELKAKKLTPAHEMDAVVARLADVLTGRNPRSALLVGPSGVGKTAALHELVRRKQSLGLGATPFWSTSGARLVAGMSGFGMWESRCQEVWREASKTKAILHLGNLIELMEVGKSEFRDQGIASFFRPYLGRGDLLAVAECTPEQVPLLELRDPHLLAVFAQIKVEEPDPAAGLSILRQFAEEGAGAEALADLDRLHRRYATYSAYPGRPLRFLNNLLNDRPRGQPVTAADVVRAFARETGLPLFLLEDAVRLDLDEARRWFAARVISQGEAVDLVVDLLATVKAGLTRPRRPIASLLFIGPTGVGKTEMAKSLAEFLFGGRERLTRLDMSEYADHQAVQRLIGGSFEAEGVLTARVREQPFAVVLLDEFEKAHPLFFDLLLQVLGEGRLTDAAGRLADFSNAVVIMTSNLGAESFQQGGFGFAGDGHLRAAARQHFVDEVRAFLRPELFNRIDRIVPFAPLDEQTTCRIAERQIALLRERDGVRYRGVALDVAPEVAAHLARKGYDVRYGARPLKRALERELLAPLADRMNAYAASTALTVEVRLDGGELGVKVRARTDASGATVAAGVSATRADTALHCQELRRDLQALKRGSAVQELEDEIYLLTQRERRLALLPHRSVDGAETLGRLAKLRRVAAELDELQRAACSLEDEALLGLYGQPALEKDFLEGEWGTARQRWDALLLALYLLRFRRPDEVTVAIYSEVPEALFELAAAYHALGGADGGRVEVWQLLPSRLGAGEKRPERKPREAPWRLLSEDASPAVWRLLPGPDHPERVPALDRHQVPTPEAFFADPRDGVVGILLGVRGPAVYPRLESEHGLHQFMRDKGVAVCLVETTEAGVAQYEPPEGIDRRGAIGGQRKRRAYRRALGLMEDSLLDAKVAWGGRDLAQGLREVVEARLLREARALKDA